MHSCGYTYMATFTWLYLLGYVYLAVFIWLHSFDYPVGNYDNLNPKSSPRGEDVAEGDR